MMRAGRRPAAMATLAGTGTTVIITVVQAFVLIPLCLRLLGTPLYGAWLAATELFVWIQLLDLGIPNLLTQRVAAAVGRDDPWAATRWASTGLLLLGAIAGILLGCGLLVAPAVAEWAEVAAANRAVFVDGFRIGVAASALLLLFNGCIGLSRGVQQTAVVSLAQVAGAIAGLVGAVLLLLAGWGLLALALGLLLRAAVSLAGGLVFLASLPGPLQPWRGRPSAAIAGETARLAPAMGGASVGYLVANNSEILLVTTFFGPVPAAVYALTRRAIDGVRSLLDAVAFAVYGAFAHLVSAGDRHRARGVLREILALRLALACLTAAVAAAATPAFVTLLFGPANFGGLALTAAFAVQLVLGGQAFLANYLYRAAGSMRDGSVLFAVEAVLRAGALAAGFWFFGLSGGPWGAAIVSLVVLAVTLGRLERTLPAGPVLASVGPRGLLVPAAVLAGGILTGALWTPPTWSALILVTMIVGTSGAAALWLLLPDDGGRATLMRWMRP